MSPWIFRPARCVAGAGALAAAPRILRAQALEKIRLAGVPTDDLTPVYYGIKSGLYQRAGLDVEIVPTASGAAATTAVIAGSYEFGKGSLIASLAAHLRGLPLVVVANGAIWDPRFPYALMLVAADSAYRTATDLNGKIAASTALNDLNSVAFSAWMDKNGGDSRTLKWVEVPNSAIEAALIEHRIDVSSLNEPQLTDALEHGKVRVMAPVLSAIAQRFVFVLYFTNADFAAKRPDIVRRWVRATYTAATYTNAHHAETAPMMAEVTQIPLAVVQKMARVDGATSSDPGLVQPAIDAAAKYKNISRSFPAKELYFSG